MNLERIKEMEETSFFNEIINKYSKNPQKVDRQGDLYREWKSFVNMSAAELERFMKKWGNKAGLSRSEAALEGVRSGRDSARAIIRMKRRKKADWIKNDWNWAKRQVRFIKRFTSPTSSPFVREPRHNLFTSHGKPTRYYLALLVWGHDPLKNAKVGHAKIY